MYDTKRQKRFAPRARRSNGDDGITFVRCRICGDHRRVISGGHLSKHGIDRETYMEEHRLSPDQLIAKEFRVIQSSREGTNRMVKRIGSLSRKFIRQTAKSLPAISRTTIRIYTPKEFGYSVIGTKL